VCDLVGVEEKVIISKLREIMMEHIIIVNNSDGQHYH